MKSRKELLNETPTSRVVAVHLAPTPPAPSQKKKEEKEEGPVADLKPKWAGPEYPERRFMINDRISVSKAGSPLSGQRGWIKGYRFGRREPEYSVKLDCMTTKMVFVQSDIEKGDLLIAHGGLIARP